MTDSAVVAMDAMGNLFGADPNWTQDPDLLESALGSLMTPEFRSWLTPETVAGLVNRERSRELDSHYKWEIFGGLGYSIWLHEYKSPASPGRAKTLHNHRYSFASWILRGNLSQRTFRVASDSGHLKSIELLDEWSSGPGNLYGLDRSVFHQVTDWTVGAVTIVLKGDSVAGESDVVDLDAFSIRKARSISSIAPLTFAGL